MVNTREARLNIPLKELFKYWLALTHPFHKLTKQQQYILALFLYKYHLLSKKITDPKLLWKAIFDYDVKMEIKEELDISDQTMQNNLTTFRKKGVIVDGRISPRYILDVDDSVPNYKIVFNFNVKDGPKD